MTCSCLSRDRRHMTYQDFLIYDAPMFAPCSGLLQP